MKKILWFALCLLAVCVVPFSSTAETETHIGGDFEYILLPDGTAEIAGYNGGAENIVLPERLDGYAVTGIGNSAFEGCAGLSFINIPHGVTTIGDYAFYFCEGLAGISIPNSVKSIGDYAFSYCTKLTSVSLPNDMETLGSHIFDGCSKLMSASLPGSISEISSYAFKNCESLNGISIPDGVTAIGNHAFSGCENLVSIVLPQSMTRIGDSAFENCRKLAIISIPESVTDIGEYAFYNCDVLNGVSSAGEGTVAPAAKPTAAPTVAPRYGTPGDGGIYPASSISEAISMQKLMASIGLLKDSGVDGDYGNVTISTLKGFQHFVNRTKGEEVLPVNGMCDPLTLQYLQYCHENGFDLSDWGIFPGSATKKILDMQNKLVKAGLLKSRDVDGVFGSGTIAAVKAFQRWVNEEMQQAVLLVTGMCDPDTLQHLTDCVNAGRMVI